MDIEAAAIYGLEKSGDFEAFVLVLVEGETLLDRESRVFAATSG